MKLSDEEFWGALRKNAGLFARTVRYIKKEFGEDVSRQAVRQRAMKDPEQLADIEEENLDMAEEGLHDLMRSKKDNVRLNAIKEYLKTKGKGRGYGDQLDVNVQVKKMPKVAIGLKVHKKGD